MEVSRKRVSTAIAVFSSDSILVKLFSAKLIIEKWIFYSLHISLFAIFYSCKSCN